MTIVLVGILACAIGMIALPQISINIFAAVLAVGFAFLFVTVSSRITGQIGASSNPISGMTVATVLLTALIFLAIGWTGVEHRVLALTIGGVVCVAAAVAGATSQDLKTGFIVGATPARQQIGLLFGVTTSALLIGGMIAAAQYGASHHRREELPRRRSSRRSMPATTETVKGVSYQVGHLYETQGGAPAGQVSRRRAAHDPLSRRSRNRRPLSAGRERTHGREARLAEGADHGARGRRNPHAEAAVGAHPHRRIPRHRDGDTGHSVACR